MGDTKTHKMENCGFSYKQKWQNLYKSLPEGQHIDKWMLKLNMVVTWVRWMKSWIENNNKNLKNLGYSWFDSSKSKNKMPQFLGDTKKHKMRDGSFNCEWKRQK